LTELKGRLAEEGSERFRGINSENLNKIIKDGYSATYGIDE